MLKRLLFGARIPQDGVLNAVTPSLMIPTHQQTRLLKLPPPSSGQFSPKKKLVHPNSLRKKLRDHPDKVVKILEIVPNDNLCTQESFVSGSKGSLRVTIANTEKCPKGFWKNFESDESGDIYDLVGVRTGLAGRELQEHVMTTILPALQKPQQEAGTGDDPTPVRSFHTGSLVHKYKQEALAQVLAELQPLAGSLAERYLVEMRGLAVLPATPALQFHPSLNCRARPDLGGDYLNGLPGLVAVASHPHCSDVNLQVTYLHPRYRDKHRLVAVPRKTFGSFSGPTGLFHHCEIVDNWKGGTSLVCEGVETALSCHQAAPHTHLIATLGKQNYARLDPALLNSRVVLVMDNDGQDLASDKVLLKTTKRLKAAGKEVFIVIPPNIDGRTKTDMNDILRARGIEAVEKLIRDDIKEVSL